jgi:hypothetical protein
MAAALRTGEFLNNDTSRRQRMLLTQDQEMIRDAVRSFAQEELWPHAAQWDRDHTFPHAAHRGLAALGAQWAANGVLQSFAEAGGVIVVLDGAQGNSEMAAFIDSAGLLALNGHSAIALDDATTRFFNRAPGDALGIGVVSPLSPVPYSCTFDTSVVPSSETAFVITDAASPAVGNPVVVHRTVAVAT